MDRRAFLASTGAALVAAPLAAEAQPAGKVYRIGYLTVPSRETAQDGVNAFQRGLRDLGWIEGQNVVVHSPESSSNSMAEGSGSRARSASARRSPSPCRCGGEGQPIIAQLERRTGFLNELKK